MNNNRGKSVMNFNDSRKNSQPPLQMHNFMPMPSSSVHIDHNQSEAQRRASQMKQNMQIFWRERLSDICDAPTDVRTPHILPLARIKKVMKSDENVKMISADTPVVFGKACELFVMEITLRAWMHTQQNKRKTVQRNDLAQGLRDEHILGFLHSMFPVETDHDNHHVHHNHHHHHQEANAAIPTNHDDVYVPLPVMPPPNYYMHTVNNQPEVAPRGVAPHDHHLAFPAMNMNLHQHNPSLGLSGTGRNRGMQHINPSFPLPSHNDGPNAHPSFKEYFQ